MAFAGCNSIREPQMDAVRESVVIRSPGLGSEVTWTEFVDQADKVDVVGHVLGPWSKSDEEFVKEVVKLGVKEIICYLETSKFESISFSALKKTEEIS